MSENKKVPAPAARERSSYDRRGFLGRIGITTTAAAASVGLPTLLGPEVLEGEEIGPVNDRLRSVEAFQIRTRAAIAQIRTPLPQHPTNGDEELYTSKIATFTKALPHNALGEVDLSAYQAMIHALSTGKSTDFEAIPFGGSRKLGSPLTAYNFVLEGADSHHLGLPAPPAFSSALEASEIAEDYWHALTRDVAFTDYGSNATINAAASDLSAFSDFSGPRFGGQITTATLFRGNLPGDLTGPYVSQFLWLSVPFGGGSIAQQYKSPVPGDDHMTTYSEWLNIQNGIAPSSTQTLGPAPRYISDQRGLAEYTHRDFSGQAALTAGLILSSYGNAALDMNNPYLGPLAGFGGLTFGMAHMLDLLGRIVISSLCANFFQKWLVHRSLRPEEFGEEFTISRLAPRTTRSTQNCLVPRYWTRFSTGSAHTSCPRHTRKEVPCFLLTLRHTRPLWGPE